MAHSLKRTILVGIMKLNFLESLFDYPNIVTNTFV